MTAASLDDDQGPLGRLENLTGPFVCQVLVLGEAGCEEKDMNLPLGGYEDA